MASLSKLPPPILNLFLSFPLLHAVPVIIKTRGKHHRCLLASIYRYSRWLLKDKHGCKNCHFVLKKTCKTFLEINTLFILVDFDVCLFVYASAHFIISSQAVPALTREWHYYLRRYREFLE